MGLFGKKKEDDSGLDVLAEIKEPFSFANFFEDHVVERYKKIRKFLEEKGILFFLLSPFQQRNRLIVELVVIVFGVLVGVVPRSMDLIQQAKERNAASEMAALIDKNTVYTVGSISVRPLASSQYEKQHLLAFYIDTANGSSVPSKADRYDVELSPARGVTDAESITYSYEVLPVSDNGRLLLVYTDNRNQNDTTGIFHLSIRVAADEIPVGGITPMEVVLSDTQETNELFGKNGINLASLTEGVLNDANTPIANKEKAFEDALSDYEMEVERIVSLPLGLTPQPSVDTLKAFCLDNRIYPTLTDTSTTNDIANVTELTQEEASILPEYAAGITMGSVLYREGEDPVDNMAADPGAADPAPTEGGENTGEPSQEPPAEPEPAGEPAGEGANVPVEAPPAAGTFAEPGGEPAGEGTPAEQPAEQPAGQEPAAPEGEPVTTGEGLGTEQVEAPTEEVEAVYQELASLQAKLNNVLKALSDLNQASRTKYDVLKSYKLVLNRELDVKAFPETRTVSAVAE